MNGRCRWSFGTGDNVPFLSAPLSWYANSGKHFEANTTWPTFFCKWTVCVCVSILIKMCLIDNSQLTSKRILIMIKFAWCCAHVHCCRPPSLQFIILYSANGLVAARLTFITTAHWGLDDQHAQANYYQHLQHSVQSKNCIFYSSMAIKYAFETDICVLCANRFSTMKSVSFISAVCVWPPHTGVTHESTAVFDMEKNFWLTDHMYDRQ